MIGGLRSSGAYIKSYPPKAIWNPLFSHHRPDVAETSSSIESFWLRERKNSEQSSERNV